MDACTQSSDVREENRDELLVVLRRASVRFRMIIISLRRGAGREQRVPIACGWNRHLARVASRRVASRRLHRERVNSFVSKKNVIKTAGTRVGPTNGSAAQRTDPMQPEAILGSQGDQGVRQVSCGHVPGDTWTWVGWWCR